MANVTNALLNELKRVKRIRSDYALAKYLGVAQQTISKYRMRQTQLAPDIALRVADELNRDREEILSLLEAERTGHPEVAKAWKNAARRLSGKAAAVLVAIAAALGGPGGPTPAQAGRFDISVFPATVSARPLADRFTHYATNVGRRLHRWAQAARSALARYLGTIPGRAALGAL